MKFNNFAYIFLGPNLDPKKIELKLKQMVLLLQQVLWPAGYFEGLVGLRVGKRVCL